MTTESILSLALEMSDLDSVPSDTQVYCPGTNVRRVLAGIDLKEPELILAASQGYDLVLAHHPCGGSAALRYHEVLYRHVDQLVAAGVPEQVARAAVDELAYDVRLSQHMANHDRAPSVARALDIAYMNVHTPLDEIGRRRLATAVAETPASATVGDLIAHLHESFVEFQAALTEPFLVVGDASARLGRAAVSHGAGTNGGYPVAKAYFDHGLDTVIYIHCHPHAARKLAAEYGSAGVNLLITGHTASDSIGIRPFLASLRERGLEVAAISGILPPV